jgi:hypothetical protein
VTHEDDHGDHDDDDADDVVTEGIASANKEIHSPPQSTTHLLHHIETHE